MAEERCHALLGTGIHRGWQLALADHPIAVCAGGSGHHLGWLCGDTEGLTGLREPGEIKLGCTVHSPH